LGGWDVRGLSRVNFKGNFYHNYSINMKHSLLLFFFTFFLAAGCGLGTVIKDSTTAITQALDGAISKLGAESANLQQIMDETLGSLPKDVQATIRSDISNTFQRGISAASSEVRCDIDFIRDRLRQSLQRLKAKILGNPIPDVTPQICNVVPAAIDMGLRPEQRNRLEFFGYDFDLSEVKVLLFNGTTQIDVTNLLSKTTHYHMVLNLGGNGVNLTSRSSRIVLRHKDSELSAIQVIQEVPDICETKIREHAPGMVSFIPPHTNGDKEFKGHGPAVTCSVVLTNHRSRVDATISMHARETEGDRTTASGSKTVTVYTPDPGFEVAEIIGPRSASFSYTDTNHALDRFGGSGPVSQFVFMGDGAGSDAGIHTRVDVSFNSLRFNLKENRDCVGSSTLRTLVLQNGLSPAKLSKIRAVSPKMLEIPSEQGDR
jgi:hypothetical protein